jgi:hypothetical protein
MRSPHAGGAAASTAGAPRHGGLHTLSLEPRSTRRDHADARPLASPLATPRHRAPCRRRAPRKLHFSSKQQVDFALESACCKRAFQVFQMFHMYVASVSYEYCICCNGCTRMLQASVHNVSSIFSDICCKCVYLDVAYVSHICLLVFCLDVAYVYNGFKCF